MSFYVFMYLQKHTLGAMILDFPCSCFFLFLLIEG